MYTAMAWICKVECAIGEPRLVYVTVIRGLDLNLVDATNLHHAFYPLQTRDSNVWVPYVGIIASSRCVLYFLGFSAVL